MVPPLVKLMGAGCALALAAMSARPNLAEGKAHPPSESESPCSIIEEHLVALRVVHQVEASRRATAG